MTTVPDPARPLLQQLGGDVAMLREIVDLFLDDTPRLLGAIGDCLSRGDAVGARRTAHTLAGSSGNFDAPRVVELARVVEAHARDGRLDEAGVALTQLDAAVQPLLEALRPAGGRPCEC